MAHWGLAIYAFVRDDQQLVAWLYRVDGVRASSLRYDGVNFSSGVRWLARMVPWVLGCAGSSCLRPNSRKFTAMKCINDPVMLVVIIEIMLTSLPLHLYWFLYSYTVSVYIFIYLFIYIYTTH